MKSFICFLFGIFFLFSAKASTMLELGATTQTTSKAKVSGTANPLNTLKQAKKTVKEYQDMINQSDPDQAFLNQMDPKDQNNKSQAKAFHQTTPSDNSNSLMPPGNMDPKQFMPPGNMDPNQFMPPGNMDPNQFMPPNPNDFSGQNSEENSQDEVSKNDEPQLNPVDYKAGIQVFYKRTCPDNNKNCNRGAVLTNIKSVIFDYSHSRGSFVELKSKVPASRTSASK